MQLLIIEKNEDKIPYSMERVCGGGVFFFPKKVFSNNRSLSLQK